MTHRAGTRHGVGPGRLDPTVRALLRAFLAPAVADRYASALQPIAVADRDAAVAGAVSALRARFFVLPEELAITLVEDTGWSVQQTATMLGMPTLQIRVALREAEIAAKPRVGAPAPDDLDQLSDEAAMVEALLSGQPVHRRDPAEAAAELDDEPVDVELATALPAHLGRPALEAQVQRSDRLQRIVVNLTVVAVVVLTVLAVDATRPGEDEVALPDTPVEEPTATPSTGPTTGTDDAPAGDGTDDGTDDPDEGAGEQLPIGPPVVDEVRFVASVDPVTGEPGPELTTATSEDDPRLWLRLAQLPEREVLLELEFSAPSGRSTVRPVLLTDRTPLVSVRLPDELGREPGRYAASITAQGLTPTLVELQIEPSPEGDDPTPSS